MHKILITILLMIPAILFFSCGDNNTFKPVSLPPYLVGEIAAPESAGTQQFIYASVTVEDPNGLDVQAKFVWGNGYSSQYSSLKPSGSQITIPYSYQTAGSYTIRVFVRNSKGIVNTETEASHTIAIIQYNTESLIVDLTVNDNKLHLTTSKEVELSFNYAAGYYSDKKFNGYSSAVKRINPEIAFPVEDSGLLYTVNLIVNSTDLYQDTTFTFTSTQAEYPLLRVDFVDVKQADGTWITTPEGQFIAVDGGYGSRIPSFAHPNAGWHGNGIPIMLNYVLERGISNFSYLIETHNHMDHWGGLADIRDDGRITYENYLSPDQNLGYASGDYLTINSSVSFRILNIGFPQGIEQSNVNNSSIVLKIEYGDIAYLLTGDAEEPVETHLTHSPYNLSADIYKAGHHGSMTSSKPYFLAKVLDRKNQIVTLSFGTGNPYGFPHQIDRFSAYEVYGTGYPSQSWSGNNFHFNCGHIETYTDGKVIIVSYYDY